MYDENVMPDLMQDVWSGRYFNGSMDMVEAVAARLTLQILTVGDVFLNDFYDQVGLPPIPMGNQFGWNTDYVEIRFGSTITPFRKSAITAAFHTHPYDLKKTNA